MNPGEKPEHGKLQRVDEMLAKLAPTELDEDMHAVTATFDVTTLRAMRSKTQTLTASSSTKAKFIAAHDAAKTAEHPRHVPQDLGCTKDGPIKIHIDDKAALKIINDDQAPTV